MKVTKSIKPEKIIRIIYQHVRMSQNMSQMKKAAMSKLHNCLIFSVLVGTRTLGPLIKSQLLYQLSYEDNILWLFHFG